jgi:integrase
MSDLTYSQIANKEIVSYTYPQLYTGVEWYVGFYAFDPARNCMRRKKIKINFVTNLADRRRFARTIVQRIVKKLESGWNPWVEAEHGKAFQTFKDVCDHYRRYITKMFNDNLYREETYAGYISYLRNLEQYNGERRHPITYIYQFDSAYVTEFLEYIYVDRNNTARTRDNYLTFLRVFSSFLLQNMYVKSKPTDSISGLGKRLKLKQRTIIEDNDMLRLYNYLEKNNKFYLLACYILHYCFIRPKEMSYLQIGHISLKRQTIFIPDTNAKNKKNAVVTLPEKVIHLMLELKVFENTTDSDFLFSTNFKPGKERRDEKQFRDFWTRYARKELRFPAKYKFYSLKDTGITSMLRKYDNLTVRDQARHATILMTDTYTPHDIMKANDLIKKHEGIF